MGFPASGHALYALCCHSDGVPAQETRGHATGDLYKVMAIHFIYDMAAGLMFSLLAKRDGLLGSRSDPTDSQDDH
jgi:hypothetical protein